MSDETPKAPEPPKPPVPAPPQPPQAPTVRVNLAPPGAPGAPKVPLAPATSPLKPAAPGTTPIGKATTQLRPVAPGTTPSAHLPKATVNLQTAPMSPPAASTLRTGSVVEDDFGEEAGVMPFAIITILITVVLLAVELLRFAAE